LPNIVSRIIAQIASPAVQDMLIRIVSAEEAGVSGVIEWLANEGLVPQLLAQLSPECSISGHSVASELLKSIITLCAPAPFNPNGGNTMQANAQPGVRDNRLIRELVSASSINTMIGFMLDPLELSDADWHGLNGKGEPPHPADPFVVHPLPSIASATSSLSHVCNILVEIIRRNNSDFSEPHLFHTLRHRLMMIQGEAAGSDARSQMEEALAELTSKMGIVHLGHLIATLSDRFADLHQILMRQKSVLGLDRFRVVELYAELLHSSNMSILNRPPGSGPTYTEEGILAGGLQGLEALGEAVEGEHGDDEAEVDISPKLGIAAGVPISSASTPTSESEASVDEEMLGSDTSTSPRNTGSPTNVESPGDIEPPSPSAAATDPAESPAEPPADTSADTSANPPAAAPISEPTAAPAGDRLKQMYITHHVLPDVVNLFFEYPNNDFMHHVVYDLLQQILNGRLGPGVNRELVVELLCEAKLVERILDAQRLNDEVVKQKHRPRLPYMGHIILISEELVKFFARCPPELHDRIASSFVESEWAAFVEGSLSETKERDARPLAGGRPTGSAAAAAAEAAEDDSSDDDDDDNREHNFGEPLSRTVAQDAFAGSGFDTFNDRDDADEFWSSQPRRHVDSSDEDDDDADWMRPSSANLHGGSDDEDFGAFNTTSRGGDTDDLDDDGWGTFTSSSSADDAENPFGDDNFAPSVAPIEISRPTPLTPYDWASQFDSEFADQDDPEPMTAGVVGDNDDAAEADADGGESDDAEDLARDTSGLSMDPAPTPAPVRVPTHTRRRSANVSSPPQHAFSPPDSSLIQASSAVAPLGPGVSSDTHVNASGMLEKEVDGQKIVVPADEVVRGVEEALESGTAPLGLEKVQSR
jgi:SIT4-associating protein SAP185/190